MESPTTCHVIDPWANVSKINATCNQADDSSESPGSEKDVAKDASNGDCEPNVFSLPI